MDPNQQPTPPVAPAPLTQPVMSGTAVNPGKTLGIVSLIASIVGAGLVGIVTGIIGLKKSKAAGQSNGLALAGIIVGAVSTIVGTFIIIAIVSAAGQLATKCAELGSGTHVVGGITYTCGTSTTE